MKSLFIDHNYYKFPDEIQTIEQFAKYLNDNYNSFIKLTEYRDENCCEPYYIAEETEEKYLNISAIDFFCEKEITVLSKDEYDNRLRKVISEKCVHCVHYIDDFPEENLDNHRGNINLDGYCWRFEKKSE